MVPRLGVILVVGVIGSQSAQIAFADAQALHLILQDDACMEQTILDDIVTDGLLLIGEWDLRQVIFTVVRIKGGTIHGGSRFDAVIRHIRHVITC